MSRFAVGDRITVTEPDTDPYDAEVLDVTQGPDGSDIHIRVYLPYETRLQLRPGVRVTRADATGGAP
ncbi:hypothetical protein [Nocardiopsis sp. NPDC057823]|uniref:hypothetical protein n=1 Tax=Nocardiopsis sp. NPDC057823 TaxID=3346256 RepID=UPI00366A83B2